MSVLSSVLTVLTCVCAAGALVAAVRANRIASEVQYLELGREKRAILEDERRDARLVTAWVAKDADGVPHVVIKNASQGTIRDVDAHVAGFHVKRLTTQTIIPTGEYCLRKHPDGPYPWTKALSTADLAAPLQADTTSRFFAVTSLIFSDSRDSRWNRDERGVLTRLGAGQPAGAASPRARADR